MNDSVRATRPHPPLCEVLLVEDNVADARLVELALAQASSRITVRRVADGAEALDFVYHRGAHASSPRPDVIFLDLNLPKIDGREVLERIKQDLHLAAIPVIIFSTSDSPNDINGSYQAGANSYVVKRNNLDEMFFAIETCQRYWCDVVTLASASG